MLTAWRKFRTTSIKSVKGAYKGALVAWFGDDEISLIIIIAWFGNGSEGILSQ